MRHVWTIATKELRSFFQSAVALIFLFTFLVAALFVFFWVETYFARNIADVRPMFEWFPLLLIFLCAALTMRMWSEEQKLGTLEVLMTLPVTTHQLIAGKFLAGSILVALALGLTLGVPITVAMMGDLDWGPVAGGYLGSLLLAGTYLSIGLCVSSMTDNQVIALIFTVLAGAVLYLPGAEAITSLFGYDTAEALRQLGTGSRFESIARGVLDAGDVVYYGSLIALFVVLNGAILDRKRWSRGKRTARHRRNAALRVGLVAANVLAINLWVGQLDARADLTERGEHSLSDTTEEILGELDQPLVIRAYISRKVHPVVQPIVPRIRDLLREYQHAGGGRVRVEFVDPLGNEELEAEIADSYDIEPFAMEFAERREKGFVQFYFSILVRYGDQHEVLGARKLISVEQRDVDDIDVRLGNFEYEVTRAIKKAAQGFRSTDRLFASLADPVELKAYVSGQVPELEKTRETIQKVAEELEAKGGDDLRFELVDPESEEQRVELYQRYGLRPFQDLLGGDLIYSHILVKIGESAEVLVPPEDPNVAELKEAILESIRRRAPGYQKTVGFWAPQGTTIPSQNPMQQPRQIPPPQRFSDLRGRIADNHRVVDVELDSGEVPAGVDVLLVAGPETLGDEALRAIDQFLMRGGTAIIMAGTHRLAARRTVGVDPVETGLEEMLETYGVRLRGKLVMDTKAEEFTMPVGPRGRERLIDISYPFFVRVDKDGGMPDAGVVAAGVPEVVMMYASPVTAVDPAKPEGEGAEGWEPPERRVLLRSSDDSWLSATSEIQPDFDAHPNAGFAKPEELDEDRQGPFDLAVAMTGSFASHFADAKGERILRQSPPGTRLVVIGSSDWASDEGKMLSQLMRTERRENNPTLVLNLIDWALEDADLLSIRAGGSQLRTLDIEEDERGTWEWINYSIAVIGLLAIVGVTVARRRSAVPMELLPPREEDEEDAE